MKSIFAAYRAAFSGFPSAVWWLAMTTMINRAGTMVFAFLTLYLVKDLELSVDQASFVMLAFGCGSVLGSYVGGRASDHFDPIHVQIVSLAGTGLAFFVSTALQTFWPLMVAMFCIGAIGDAFRPAALAAVSLVAPAHARARAIAFVRFAVNLGMAIGPALGGLLAAIDYRLLFVVDGASCWIAALVLLLKVQKIVKLAPKRRTASDATAPILADRSFVFFLFIVFVMFAVFMQVFSVLPLYFREFYALPESTIGLILGANAAMIVAFEMPLVARLEHAPRGLTLAVGGTFVGLGLAILPFASGMLWALLSTLLWTIGEMLWMPVANTIVAERGTRAGAIGQYMGYYTASHSIALIVGPVAGLAIYARFGPSVLWFSMAGLSSASAILYALGTRSDPPPLPAS